MNTALTEAIKEAYAACNADVVYLETLEIYNPLAGHFYLVKDMQDATFTLEDSTSHLFTAAAFQMTLPQSGDNGIQELSLIIDNVDQRVGDFINAVKESDDPVLVTYRPYLSTDLTTPQMNPPLVLYLTDVTVDVFQVAGKATFADIINRKFPTDLYTRARFPSLAN